MYPLSQNVNLTNCLHDKELIRVHIKFWFLKDKKVTQPQKNTYIWENPEISLEVGLFGKKLIPLICYFWFYMMHHSCLYYSAKTLCFAKNHSQILTENAFNKSECKTF